MRRGIGNCRSILHGPVEDQTLFIAGEQPAKGLRYFLIRSSDGPDPNLIELAREICSGRYRIARVAYTEAVEHLASEFHGRAAVSIDRRDEHPVQKSCELE